MSCRSQETPLTHFAAICVGLKNKNDVEIERLRLDPSIFQSAQHDLLTMTELPIWEHFAPGCTAPGVFGAVPPL